MRANFVGILSIHTSFGPLPRQLSLQREHPVRFVVRVYTKRNRAAHHSGGLNTCSGHSDRRKQARAVVGGGGGGASGVVWSVLTAEVRRRCPEAAGGMLAGPRSRPVVRSARSSSIWSGMVWSTPGSDQLVCSGSDTIVCKAART